MISHFNYKNNNNNINNVLELTTSWVNTVFFTSEMDLHTFMPPIPKLSIDSKRKTYFEIYMVRFFLYPPCIYYENEMRKHEIQMLIAPIQCI